MALRRAAGSHNLRTRLAASFRRRARHWEERAAELGWPDLANLGAEDKGMADRLEAGETVTVQGSDIGTLIYRRAIDVPSFVTVYPDGSIEPVSEREEA